MVWIVWSANECKDHYFASRENAIYYAEKLFAQYLTGDLDEETTNFDIRVECRPFTVTP